MAVTTAAVITAVAATKSIIDSGDASADAAKGQKRAQVSIEKATAEARKAIEEIFPQVSETRRAGAEAVQSLFGDFVPQQSQLFGQGNLAAQQTIANTPENVRRALLGLPVDFGALQPQQFTPNFDFLSAPLPQATQQAVTAPINPLAGLPPTGLALNPPADGSAGGFRFNELIGLPPTFKFNQTI